MILEFNPIIVPELETKMRLDVFLVDELGISRARVQHMIHNHLVKVNGRIPKKPGDTIHTGDTIIISPEMASKPIEPVETVRPSFSNITVLEEANDYLVINKPAGLLVHETDAHEVGTLADWIVEKYPEIRGVGEAANRPGIVHRLDKEASGLMVIAKNQAMFEHLKQQFQARTIDKEYEVLVHGIMPDNYGVIDFDIDRGSDGSMVSRPKIDKTTLKGAAHEQPGKAALTEFTVLKQYARFALLRVKIHTGRTHQIRVHMRAFNHPVVGDDLYFNTKLNRKRDHALGRLFLHAAKLGFDDLDGKRVVFEVTLPDKLENFLVSLK